MSSPSENPPFLFYQSVDFNVDMHEESISAMTVLWLGFKTTVKPGATFNLHCRNCIIDEIFVNNIPTEYSHRDPLKDLSLGDKKMEFLGEEMDINYRASLEISRCGELEVTVPYLTVSTTDLIQTIPKSAPKEVISRYDKLVALYKHLVTVKDYGPEDNPPQEAGNEEDADGDAFEYNKPCYLLQVKIKYTLPSMEGKYGGGLIFRRQPLFTSIFEKNVHSGKVTGAATTAVRPTKEPAQCLYSTRHSHNNLYDLDGVRCWLPCLDSLDQRAVYDVSITTQHNYSIMCSGTKVSTVHHNVSNPAFHLKTSRFFGTNRVAACTLGLFIGHVESYKMPLYKTKGKIWVATGLADFVSKDSGTNGGAANGKSHRDSEVEFIRKVSTGGSLPIKRKHTVVKVEKEEDRTEAMVVSEEETNAPAAGEEQDGPGHAKRIKTEPATSSSSSSDNQAGLPPSSFTAPGVSGSSSSHTSLNRLYENQVHHSTLGLDMALRLVHKFTSRRYDYPDICFVYIHDLGAPFMAFDSFFLLDASSLYGELSVYLEASTHLQLVQAYLYCWLGTSIPLNCFDMEFILHGAIGYIMNYYIDTIYGEDDYKYHYQKQYDTVITLEKLGKGCTLSRFYPETYDQYTMSRCSYMTNKSVVIFQLLENKIANGRDPMRIILKQLINSPALYIPKQNQGSSSPIIHLTAHDFNNDSNSPAHSGSMSPNTPSVDFSPYNSGNYSPVVGGQTPRGQYSPYAGSQSPYALVGNQSPYAYATSNHASTAAALGGQSPYVVPVGSMSPYAGGGGNRGRGGSFDYSNATNSIYNQYSPRNYELSPYVQQQQEAGGGGGYLSSIPMPMLSRQNSNSSIYSAGKVQDASSAALSLACDVITPEIFLHILRNASGVSIDIDDNFLDKYVHDSGVLFVKLHLSISEKVETQPRHIHLYTRTVGYSQSHKALSQRAVRKQLLKCRLAEVRDDIITEPMLVISGEAREEVSQQAYSRPGRRGGKRRGVNQEGDDPELTPEMLAEKARREHEKELKKSTLQQVRDIDYPVRYAIVDPNCLDLVDLSHCTSHVSLLVEQLYCDMYEHSVFFQCQAIRNLAFCSSSVSSTLTNGSLPPGESGVMQLMERIPRHKLQLRVLANVLLGQSTNINDSKLVNAHQMSIYIRAEAAFALAAYQNNFAPMTTYVDPHAVSSSSSSAGGFTWDASLILCACCTELFCDTTSHRPLPNDFTNEVFTYLRNCVLLALSTIRSQSNHTPAHVVRLLLKFTQYLEDMTYVSVDSDEGSGGGGNSAAASAYDDTHYKAVLYLVLSRIRVESTVRGTGGSSSNISAAGGAGASGSTGSPDTLCSLSSLISNSISTAYTQARALARIKYQSGQANALPELPGQGIDIAAAITALSEIDVQAVHLYSKGKAVLQAPQYAANGTLIPFRLKEYEYHQPTGVGVLTGFNYKKYFLSPSTSLKCNLSEEIIAGAPVTRNTKDDIIYCLSSPLVRVAAFEAYVRINFALHVAQYELYKNTAAFKSGTGTGPKDSTFIAASIEALDLILKSGEYSQATKQQCVQVFADVVQDRGPRVAAAGVSLHSNWNCMGWSETQAVTLPLVRCYSAEHKAAMNTGGPHMRVALKLLWRNILNTACVDQSIRATLLETWIFCFGRRIPSVLRMVKEGAAASADAEVPVTDRFFDNKLPLDRLRMTSSYDLGSQFEHQLQQPLVVTKATKAAAAAVASLPQAAPVNYMPAASSAHHSAGANLQVDPTAGVSSAGEQSLKLSLSLAGLRGKAPHGSDDGKSSAGFKFVI